MLGHVACVYDDIVETLTSARPPLRTSAHPVSTLDHPAAVGSDHVGLRQIGRRAALEAEKKALAEVLNRVRWNRKEAARVLKVSYKTLLVKINEYGLDDRRSRRGADHSVGGPTA
jgi:DNA-binding NtrC family response regulator